MPRLFILSGPDLGQIHSFTEKVRLGRVPSCEVVVKGTSISRVHAELSPEGDAWVLVDLDSSNGVHMGRVQAKRFELNDGDTFRLGEVELRFRDGGESSPVAEPEMLEETPAPVVPEVSAPEAAAEVSIEDEAEEDELFLEDEIDLGDFTAEEPAAPKPSAPALTLSVGGAAQSAPKRPVSPPTERETRKRAPESAGRRRAAEVSDRREREILQFSNNRSDSTALTSDLSQQPVWVRALAVLLALGVSAAIFWFAFRGAASLSDGPTIELEDER